MSKGAQLAGARPDLLAGHLPIHRQRTRRQHADMGVRIAARHQFPAKIVQKTPQGIGYIDDQCKYIEPLLGRNPVTAPRSD